jgi:Fic family protein
MGSCIRRLPFHPKERLGPQSITWASEMAKHNSGVSEYYDRNRTGFYTALQSVRDSGMDLTDWLDYFVEGLATQMDEVTERGKRAIRRHVIAREYALNPRQVLAVGHLLERDDLRIEELEVLCPGVNRRTLQRDLRDLIQQGVIKSIGAARAVRYILKIKGL